MTAEGLKLYKENDKEGFVKEIAEASLLGEINWDLRCFFDAGRGSLATYEIENKVNTKNFFVLSFELLNNTKIPNKTAVRQLIKADIE